MKLFRNIALGLLLFGLIVGAYIYPIQKPAVRSLGGTFTPIQAQKFTLTGAGVTSSATSIGVNSLLLPDGVTPITMSMFGSIGYATIEPGTSKEENISFTGITQNSNGTANLTGASRGLAFTTPYAASTTLAYSHAGGAYIIFSNSAPFYHQFGFLGNAQTWTGVNTYGSTTPPVYDFNPNFTNLASTTFASIGYVASTSYAGAVNATNVVKGIVQFATGLQAASSTATGSTGALLALGNGIATDTPSVPQSVSGSHVLMTTIGGFLKQTWLDLSANWTFTGNVSVPTTNTAGGFSPPGSITAYASTTPPSGWLLANGQAVSRTTYANLYSVIGTQYGVGDGSTTFNVPNLAGSMILMASSTNGISSTLGASGGATTTTIAQANIPNYTLSGTYGYSGVSGTGSTIGTGSQAPNTTVSISSNGSGVPANTISPYFVLEYIIKY